VGHAEVPRGKVTKENPGTEKRKATRGITHRSGRILEYQNTRNNRMERDQWENGQKKKGGSEGCGITSFPQGDADLLEPKNGGQQKHAVCIKELNKRKIRGA